MDKTSNIHEINRQELSGLIDRVEYAIEHDLALSIEDLKLLLSAITTLCTLQSKMEDKTVTLHKLKKLLGMVKKSEQRKTRSTSKGSKNNKGKGKRTKKAKKPKISPAVVHHSIEDHKSGDLCPGCTKGKLYKFESGQLLRITGHAPYEATQHITEQLRCNACQALYKASLPESVLADGSPNQKYGYSARTMMVLGKFYSGLPYHHQSELSSIFGCAITASTIFDQSEQVANSVMPVFYELIRQASRSKLFLIDDTSNRILDQKPQMRPTPDGKGQRLRTGVYSSGLIGVLESGFEVILFETSLGHAGEHLNEILKKRPFDLKKPTVMSDALISNDVTNTQVHRAGCNAHARRLFFDLQSLYPKEMEWVLDTYGKIWEAESDAKAMGLDEQKRLEYHKTHSLPAMEAIRDWALKRQSSKAFEEHSALGKAVTYFLTHYKRLILFCILAGVPLDNNRMEERLKIVIRGRKTAYFYKTAVGAGVANVLISIIATAHAAGINLYDYLVALQRHQKIVGASPEKWLPWNYKQSLQNLATEKLKPDKAA